MNEALNSIRLSGRIFSSPVYDHTIFGEAFYKFEVSASRLSGTEDILPVTISERLLVGLENGIAEVGNGIEISGQIRSYNQRTETGSRLIITVFAREVYFFGSDEIDDFRYFNETELIGHICKPVTYRTTPFSREIADILIAVNRRYGKSDYLPCIAWGRNARFASELTIGDYVLVRGRMQSRIYQKDLGNGVIEDRIAYEISCSSIEKKGFATAGEQCEIKPLL